MHPAPECDSIWVIMLQWKRMGRYATCWVATKHAFRVRFRLNIYRKISHRVVLVCLMPAIGPNTNSVIIEIKLSRAAHFQLRINSVLHGNWMFHAPHCIYFNLFILNGKINTRQSLPQTICFKKIDVIYGAIKASLFKICLVGKGQGYFRCA